MDICQIMKITATFIVAIIFWASIDAPERQPQDNRLLTEKIRETL